MRSELLPSYKLLRDRISIRIISLSKNGNKIKEITVIGYTSQISQFSLEVGPQGSIGPACPHKGAGRCMKQTNKQTD